MLLKEILSEKRCVNMRIFLELLRIIFIFILLGGLAWLLIGEIYTEKNVQKYQWLGAIGIYMVLYLLYKNRLQFSGWYKGAGRKKLPRKVSWILICLALSLLILPLIIGAAMN